MCGVILGETGPVRRAAAQLWGGGVVAWRCPGLSSHPHIHGTGLFIRVRLPHRLSLSFEVVSARFPPLKFYYIFYNYLKDTLGDCKKVHPPHCF